ncbi:DNA polymerase III subunit gamma/tau [Leuconostoc lactis]|uniref:DNA polymerase III subunit gamma/tau n=1 Tax=Leuconostoc lactis TaxID=1246 RepID=UPI0009FDDE9C|nr:DNA polymerase III subunit gamma/tau [Leuconostoc lactis]ORI83354.1 DNA polymerase III subunit gamma/tau [Leuconostoc lactis]ORI85902.1 DNA polymerase III subunit gamma/tau [Leuconostoc lactis]
MAYQALYRVYRPRTFDDMIGQEVITQTLKNAIETEQTGHAYLFSGPRGTGKTSAAKIFAREVNGIDPQTDDAQIPDIVEFDAASNSRVEDMRDILANVDYAPIEAKYKVYIIDEVHMLSNSAFNALLKTLEEPPANVKFILATTEPQKVPVTILSRTQRFEFKRIATDVIQARLADILTQRDVAYDDDALRIIANVAEGGMRDALSILDQVMAYGTDRVTVDNALQVTGSTTTAQLLGYMVAVSQGDTPKGLQILHDILLAGKDAQRFVVDVLGLLRDVMMTNVAPDLIKTAIAVTDLTALAQQLSAERIQQMMVILDDIQQQLMQTMQSDVYLELLTVKLAMTAAQQTPVPVQPSETATPTQPVKSAPQVIAAQPKPAVTVETVPPTPTPVPPTSATLPVAQPVVAADTPTEESAVANQLWARTGQNAVFAVLQQAKRETLSRVKAAWSDLISQFGVAEQALLTIAAPVAASEEGLVLAFDFPPLLAQALQDAALQTQLRTALAAQQLPTEMVLITQDSWQQERSDYVAQLKAGTTQSLNLADIPRVSQTTTTQTQSTPTPEQTGLVEPAIVAEAKKLFGDDIVQVID